MNRDPREEKLPVWARELLSKERERASRAEGKLQDHLETIEKSRIWFGSYDNPIYVPEPFGHQTLHFQVLDDSVGGDIQVRIKKDHKGRTGIEVNGGDSVTVELDASNLFRVYLQEK
jgi:hypothetical protein